MSMNARVRENFEDRLSMKIRPREIFLLYGSNYFIGGNLAVRGGSKKENNILYEY